MLNPPLIKEAKALVKLAWPLLIAQVTQVLMGACDTIMAGQYSATDMAAVAVGFSIVNPVQFFIQGLALALPPIISRLQGAKLNSDVANAAQQVGYILFVISVAFAVSAPFVPWLIGQIPMDEALRPITTDYVVYLCLGIPAFGLYQWLRNYCEGLGYTKPTMIITLIGLVVNVIANYALIYGKFGAPELGGAGCGLATTVVLYSMFISTLLYVAFATKLKQYRLLSKLNPPCLKDIVDSLRLGVPIAMTILFEVTLFAMVALLLAPFGTTVVAAHQIALSFSAVMFMFPMSIGMALCIRIGYRLGQQDPIGAQYATKAALLIGLCIAFSTASLTLIGRSIIVAIYTQDIAVFDMAIGLLVLAAGFQLSDAVQVISANALRGYKDTMAMLNITFCAYWLIGLPIGVVLGRTDWLTDTPMYASGFWVGFIVGLTSAALLLGLRLAKIQRKQLVNA